MFPTLYVFSWEIFLRGCEGQRAKDVVVILCKALSVNLPNFQILLIYCEK